MAFKFSLLSLEKTNDCKEEDITMVKRKAPQTKLTKALKKCKGKQGKSWNKCLSDNGIKKRKKK